jgi:hypothetical protein
MQRLFFLFLLFISSILQAQTDTGKWLRAFPITDYIVDLNDSTKLVQLEMPEGYTLKEKQPGLLYGVYNTSRDDAVKKGYGRCHLIKGQYYYFAIGHNTSGLPVQKGDLLYTNLDKTNIYYGLVPKIAAHFIRLLNVYGEPLFDRYTIFFKWTGGDEMTLIDSMLNDIKFTGRYFLNNAPAVNVPVKSGDYKDQKALDVMMACKREDVIDFLDYIIARPRLYAGKEWKLSEIFATWLVEGAPKVIK